MIPDPASTTTANSDTTEEVAALKGQMFLLLLALIVVTGTLTAVLYRQVSMATKDIAAAQNQSIRVSAQVQASIGAFVQRLVAYGQKHPDFQPILNKYGIAPAGVPGSAPQGYPPAAPAAPKK
jgi:hypothetical protein